MPHRRTLEGLSRPGLRLQGWRRLPAGSKIAVVILALIAAMAILAPVVAPYDEPFSLGVVVRGRGVSSGRGQRRDRHLTRDSCSFLQSFQNGFLEIVRGGQIAGQLAVEGRVGHGADGQTHAVRCFDVDQRVHFPHDLEHEDKKVSVFLAKKTEICFFRKILP